MSIIKSFSVGDGDMFYIDHNSDNFSIIDCCMDDGNKEAITQEIKDKISKKGIIRFISTHPDEDHLQGLKYLDEQIGIVNFYCVENSAVKTDETEDFKDYSCEKVRIPDIKEQAAIAEVLSTADREIELLQQDIEQEKQKKKALMQLLLMGIVRVKI